MDTTTRCIFCGQDRDLDDESCASCGRGWIDRRLPATPGGTGGPVADGTEGDVPPSSEQTPSEQTPSEQTPSEQTPSTGTEQPEAVGAATAPEGSSGETEPPETEPSETEPSPPAVTAGTPLSHRLVVAGSVVVVIVAWLGILAWITGQGGDGSTVVPTTGGVAGPGGVAETTTTEPATEPTGAATSTTTSPPATDPPSTTVQTTTTVPEIEPVGDPIPDGDLALGAFAIGPLDFATEDAVGSEDALGRLVATFGQPDELTTAGTAEGLCSGDQGTAVTWGPLTAVFEGEPEEAVLVGYRLGEDDQHPAGGLETLSGLQVGATTTELETVYASFQIEYETVDGTPGYIVVRPEDDVTLLWGPVSSTTGDGIVEGIYSPRPCDGGPTPET